MIRPENTTRALIGSDLHINHHKDETSDQLINDFAEQADGLKPDVLILAGDLFDGFARSIEFLNNLHSAINTPVLFVPGNHDFYGYPLSKSVASQVAGELDHGIHLLYRDEVVIKRTRFLGATLWSSLANGTHADSARFRVSDFSQIESPADNGEMVSTDEYMAEHQEDVSWLESMLRAPHDGATVVITHHAPSFRSLHPRFAGSDINGLFCSDLDALLFRHGPEVLVHAHLHDAVNYRIGATQLISNPRGYPSETRGKRYQLKSLDIQSGMRSEKGNK